MNDLQIDNWVNEGILPAISEIDESQVKKIDENRLVLFKDMSDDDSYKDVLIYQFHGSFKSEDFEYEKLLVEMTDAQLSLRDVFVSFNSWEEERETIQKLKQKENSATKKNKIENNFALFNSVYFQDSDYITIQVEDDGINYLESPERREDLSAMVVNCSLAEIKKLYNCTGVKLFKRNVRNGIISNKSTIRSIFSKYLSIIDDTTDSEGGQDDYDPELFWFSHNGITVFVDNENPRNINFQNDEIVLNRNFCSVINGAQTITNFFLVYSELKYQYQSDEEKLKKLELLISKIKVKLTVIQGKNNYSNFITRGLNTQNPITDEDFIAISEKVMNLNKVFSEIHILKTGEVERDGGLTPLQFVKQFLIVDNKPGLSKNFNKGDLETQINSIYSKIVLQEGDAIRLKHESEETIQKIVFLNEVESWWKKKNRETTEKDLIDRYAKNYFESFVIKHYENIADAEGKEKIFDVYFEKFKEIISKKEYNYNSFKNDTLYNEIIEEYEKQKVSNDINKDLDDAYYNELKKFLNYSSDLQYLPLILKFNYGKIQMDNIRVIKRVNGNIMESFYLSSKTFSELYQNLSIEDRLINDKEIKESDFKTFSESTLYNELIKKYNIYVIDVDEDSTGKELITHITIKRDFNFNLSDEDSKKVQQLYKETINAFIEGETSKFPSVNKGDIIYVQPKAINKEDLFLFTNGEQLPKQTFWISKDYIKNIINK
ncbi:hypothetical protein [Streptococcus gordonii]|uniref:hypothetical protein n=1 Tax=Streptococcus gordonii TaxID=1302 RepID=UPI000779DBFE|nr:hypothetical protein [Streptococcus gordonii]VTT24255.1 AIPR protein [Streptococcus gordonii]